MAQRQSKPQQRGGHLDDKYRQNTANIAGKGRRTFFTTPVISQADDFGSGIQTLYSRKFRSRYFRTPGDTIAFTSDGVFIADGLKSARMYLSLYDDETNTLLLRLFESYIFTGNTLPTMRYYMDGIFQINVLSNGSYSLHAAGKLLVRENNVLYSPDTFLDAAGYFLGSSKPSRLRFDITGETSASPNEGSVEISHFNAELVPAVIL